MKKGGNSKLSQIHNVVTKCLKDADPSVDLDPSVLKVSRPHLPSGSTVLDYLIGGRPNRFGVAPCPGWPKGAISNIFGHESSGKTTVALTTAAEVCRRGGEVVFIDWEHALSPEYAAIIGVPITDPDKFYLVQPRTLEDGLKVLWASAAAGADLIILDSVGAGVPAAIFGQSLDEQGNVGQVGLVARIWSVFLPKIASAVSDSGSHIMGISQLRKKISTGGFGGGGGPTTTHQGGDAWKFYTSVRMEFARIKSEKTTNYDALQHKNVERATSAVIKATMKKSKVAGTQQAEAEFYIGFGEGIDDARSLIDIASAHGIIHKGGAGWYTWERANGEQIKAQGINNLKAMILKADGGWPELKTGALNAMSAGGGLVLTEPDPEDEDIIDLGFITGESKPAPAVDEDVEASLNE